MKTSIASIRFAKIQITETILILLATMLLPVLVHLLPEINHHPAGMVFLPIFLAPMIAVFFFKRHVALIAGILAPLLNYLLLGRPTPEMVLLLSTEVVGFVLLLGWLKNLNGIKYVAAPLAYVAASFLTAFIAASVGIVAAPFTFWTNAVVVGFPGILILAAFNIAVLKFNK